ncbi:MAG: Flp pilus assembly protein CpaB [Vulcanimicrobiaceae bacterium]
MNTRRITLIVAVVLAVGTGILTLKYLSGINQQAQTQQQAVELKPIVIAATDIPARMKITPEMLTKTQRATSEVEPQALTDPNQAKGDIALISIPAGSTITATKVGQPAEVGLTVRLKPGMRAVSIPVDRVKSVSSLVQPGDRVDVLASVGKGVGVPPKTFTIIRGALVLAINSQLEQSGPTPAPDSGAAATVTLGVSPQQANLLTVADLNTTLRLALRSPQEPVRSLPAEALQFSDLSAPEKAAPAAAGAGAGYSGGGALMGAAAAGAAFSGALRSLN